MCLKNYIAALYNINVQENISDFLKSFIKGDWRNCYTQVNDVARGPLMQM